MSSPLSITDGTLTHYDALSFNIKYYRILKKMTQQQLAVKVGVTAEYISLLERSTSKNSPSLEAIFRIANALEIKPHKLFKKIKGSP